MKPSRLQLERWIAGDLDAAEQEALEDAFAADPALHRRAETLAKEAEQLRVPAMARPEPNRSWVVPTLLGVAVAALLAVFLVVRPDPIGGFRGAAFELTMHRIRLGNAQPVGAIVDTRAGDRLQWTVEPDADGYVHVFDVQGDGVVQTWMAATFTAARQVAEGAVILDAYDGQERIYVVVAPRALDADDVKDALGKAHQVPLAELDALPGLGRGVGQRSVLVLEAL